MASAFLFTFLFLFLIISSPFSCSPTSKTTLKRGSSISVEDLDNVLISPNGKFTAGFYSLGENAYYFAIWFTDSSCSTSRRSCTVIWMANRDVPVNRIRSKLSLLKNGNLVLTDAGGRLPVWATDTASSLSQLDIKDNGDLVLHSMKGEILWHSFDSPTDTLLPLQIFNKDTTLVSSRSGTNFSTGFYKFYFDNDNVIRLLYDGPEISSVFWPDPGSLPWEEQRSTYNSSRIAMLDSLGNFTSTDNFSFFSADYGLRLQRRLKLDFDGNLRLYSRVERKRPWFVSWQLTSKPCTVHGICGPNSVCTYDVESGRRCSCIPGFKMANVTDWSSGCKEEFHSSCDSKEVTFHQLRHVEFYGYDFGFFPNKTFDECKNICLQRCDCKGFQFKFVKHDHPSDLPYCFAKTQLLNGQRSPDFEGDFYLKVPNQFSRSWPLNEFDLAKYCSHGISELPIKYTINHGIWSVELLLWFVIAVGVFEIFGITLLWIFLIRNQQDTGITQGYLQAATGFKRFSYSELKRITRNFKEEIGRGGGGIVYKGKLSDGQVAAVKQLKEAHQGEAEFLAEVSTIGKLNHMNLINMWGYCADKNHRLLVYEFMEHGSLAENLNSISLDWKKRFEIAVGTAKGLSYLHEECLEWILHCDVKPQNILLDSDYRPKVSDFGLSRLASRVSNENSNFTKLRGTRGYMAPEWIFNLPITSKVDVYSYGIVVLEMMTGKSPAMSVPDADSNEENVDQKRVVAWIREKKSEAATKGCNWIEEIIDPIIGNEYDIKKLENLVQVALQCVEEDRNSRPTMSQVVEMLSSDENAT